MNSRKRPVPRSDLPPGATRPKVYSYARWSTAEQSRGDSNRRQAQAALKWAEKNGLELDLTLKIVDKAVSAYRGANALDGGLSRFLDACRNGGVEPGSFLLVESLDRISRMAPRRAQRLIDEIVDNGVTIVTLSDGQRYNAERLDNDPAALMIALMVAWRAHEESKTKGRRIAEAWREKRRRVRENPAERLTRRGPSWLVPTVDGWSLHPAKASAVRRIYALTLAGIGEHRIVSILNGEGVPVLGRAEHWHRSSVAKVLRNPAVVGTLVPGFIRYSGGRPVRVMEEPIPNAYPAVISEADWLAVRGVKDGKVSNPRGRHSGKPAHFFAALAKCPVCGSAMIRVNKGSGRKGGIPTLVCRAARANAGCSHVMVPLDQLESALLGAWKGLFREIPSLAGATNFDIEHRALKGAIRGTEDHLGRVADCFEAHPLETLAREMGRLEAELRGMRVRLRELDERRRMADRCLISGRVTDLCSLLKAQDADGGAADVDRPSANALLRLIFDSVTIDYLTEHLRFRWRQGGETLLRYAPDSRESVSVASEAHP